jgi:polyhydroxybutyrate depolymerase
VPPQAAEGLPLPLILNLHGASMTAIEEEGYTGMDTAADQDAFLVAYPNGTPLTKGAKDSEGWNAGQCCRLPATSHVNDVAFLHAAIADIEKHTPVDPRRIYVTGYSNGGMMAYEMADEASDNIAAVASVSGQVEQLAIQPKRPVPVLEFHSVDDPAAKWGGIPGKVNGGWNILPVMHGIDAWVQADHCKETPEILPTISGTSTPGPNAINTGESLSIRLWHQCAGDGQVVLYQLTGSGHVWPGATLDLSGVKIDGSSLGRSTDLATANQVIWKFFSGYQLPAPTDR